MRVDRVVAADDQDAVGVEVDGFVRQQLSDAADTKGRRTVLGDDAGFVEAVALEQRHAAAVVEIEQGAAGRGGARPKIAYPASEPALDDLVPGRDILRIIAGGILDLRFHAVEKSGNADDQRAADD